MAKIDITLTDDEKRKLQAVADNSALQLAMWVKVQLLLAVMRK
jgi:hypothetical protein